MFITKISLIFIAFINLAFANDDSYYQFDDTVTYKQMHFNLIGKNQNYQIATHYYQNKDSSKIFVLIHGYLDNCGYMVHIGRYLIRAGYSLFCVELPGHGMSSGNRGEIDSFETYGLLLKDLLNYIPKHYTYKNFLAHSTGTVPFLIHQFNFGKNEFKKTILLSPLVRSRMWNVSKMAYFFLHQFIDTIPRVSKEKPMYERFNQVLKKDPFYIDFMSLKWFGKLKEWNEKVTANQDHFQNKVNIIFAGLDEVIDTDFNMTFYREKFPNANIQIIKESHHHLDYETPENDKEFFRILNSILIAD